MMMGISRDNLRERTRETLQSGAGTSADVFLVSGDEGLVIVKDYGSQPSPIRRQFGRWSLAREERAYRRLESVCAVPQLLGRLDAEALILEYRPGILLSRSLAGKLPGHFLDEFEEAVAAMHQAGVVHLDLRHRSNVLASEEGRPILIDFASALFFDPGWRSGRFALALFKWVDQRAVEKWRKKLPSADQASVDSGSGMDSPSSAGSRGANRAM